MILKKWGQESLFSNPYNVCGDPVRPTNDNLGEFFSPDFEIDVEN